MALGCKLGVPWMFAQEAGRWGISDFGSPTIRNGLEIGHS